MKLCHDCKHAYKSPYMDSEPEDCLCKAPRNIQIVNRITGEKTPRWRFCRSHRVDGFFTSLIMKTCGKRARWFEPRDEVVKNPPKPSIPRQFKSRSVTLTAFTWDEMLDLGREICKAEGREHNIIRGMPWSFHINGRGFTHENDECYLFSTSRGSDTLTPNDMLVIEGPGEVYAIERDIFDKFYKAVS